MPKIEMTKQYRTRDGRPARVLCVDRKDPRHPVVAMVEHSDGGEDARYYTAEGGSMYFGDECDLIEATPYDGLKVDDLVMVIDGNHKFLRHFAGVNKEGSPCVWFDGSTSATAGDELDWYVAQTIRPATEAEIAAAREKNLRALRGE